MAGLLAICFLTVEAQGRTLVVRPAPPPSPKPPKSGRATLPGVIRFTVTLGPGSDLQATIDEAADGDTIRILPGRYRARPTSFVESLCGNCQEHTTRVRASRGFYIRGKSLVLQGVHRDSTILVTGAGYGILVEDSPFCRIESLTVIGGRRDADGNATDAGIVVRRSRVEIVDVAIRGNTDRVDTVVVGIGGIMGREGAEILVARCLIEDNGWDGVALYRGATAVIRDNVIRGGRGAGVGITWDAVAVVERNDISGYWKGIGTFGDSWAVVRNNAIHDNLGWGLVVTGSSWMDARHNVIVRNGNCGFALWSEAARARLLHNVIVENGWREEWVCPQVGVWMNGRPENLEFRYNDVWGNVAGDYRDMENLTGRDGNLSVDPAFRDSLDFRLRSESPLRDAGDPAFSDPDGSRPDLGLQGGAAGWPLRTR
jgi:hypothetical protein